MGAWPFYLNRKTTAQNVNAISIYGLTPGTQCNVANLKVCDTICDGYKDLNMTFMALGAS